ncbi:hypothetical protein NDU88_005455 [Pleurodeles waltl]|uniref:Uncharacterized protein n=1 Tax=Pleurodeles waltl TaxID=8319 RepID=A0AAV7QL07_PLEWA|nr:hypothetical protein NDU88_005455 [Pleurodeles waltl]
MILPQKAGTKERAGGGVQSEARRREEKPCKCAGRRDSEAAETLRPRTRIDLRGCCEWPCWSFAYNKSSILITPKNSGTISRRRQFRSDAGWRYQVLLLSLECRVLEQDVQKSVRRTVAAQ